MKTRIVIIICAILLSCGLFFIYSINSYEKAPTNNYEKAPTETQVRTYYKSNKQLLERIKSELIEINVSSLSISYEKDKITAKDNNQTDYIFTNKTLINDLLQYFKSTPIKHSNIDFGNNKVSISIVFSSYYKIGSKSWVKAGLSYYDSDVTNFLLNNKIENNWYYVFVGMT